MNLYEKKEYRRALKLSESILKNSPTHGETLCMKGLILNYMSRKEEAHEFAKKGLMHNMMSHVCWHVFGLIHRADRNYNESIKCYKQALRIDKDNMQILRDLSLLQIQMRDLKGFNATRGQILTLKATQKFHWVSYALSYHLLGQHTQAVGVIDTLASQDVPAEQNAREALFCKSELEMYKLEIMKERGTDLGEVLAQLDKVEPDVLDQSAFKKLKAEVQLLQSDFAGAAATYLSIFAYGVTEDYTVHSGYQAALLQLPPAACGRALKLGGTAAPSSAAEIDGEQAKVLGENAVVKRIQLTLLTEPAALETALSAYIHKAVVKGVPSLSSDLASLYVTKGSLDLSPSGCKPCKDPVDVAANGKYQLVCKIAAAAVASLESTSCVADGADKLEGDKLRDALVWGRYLQVLLLELRGDYEAGLELLEVCIGQMGDSLEAIDLCERKGRLLKLSGDVQAAADCLDEARQRDTADRYINNKTTKYMLRAGRHEQAEATIGLFTRHEANPNSNLFEMQCSWYELEYARCMLSQNDMGKALKKFVAIEKHFDDFADDQFDFHTYCIRKMTLRAYVAVLRLEDHIWGHKYYRRAARGAVDVYMHLIDNPLPPENEEPDYSNMSAAEKKKAKAAARKKKNKQEAAKLAIEEEKKKAAAEEKKRREEEEAEAEKNEASGDGDKKKTKKAAPPVAAVDEDPDGMALMRKDAAAEATKFANSLKAHAPEQVDTWVINFDVAMKRGKWMLALQALFKGGQVLGGDDSHEIFERTVQFAQKLEASDGGVTFESDVVRDVAVEMKDQLLGGGSVTDFVAKTKASKTADKALHLSWKCSLARAGVAVGAMKGQEAAAEIVAGGLDGVRGGYSIKACVDVAKALKDLGGDAAQADWNKLCKARFARATVF
ncbi:hypothetical protein TeGR_g12530 [Tetraparma gracilis]|uniref:Uncharacterized protein n=1 Tax=Tetraparma gracilis TaxID=2962635 RepID=A0ABQ6M7M1_9STRA|nr:hypothetical protein TeGR_g12530 [Tetraparma gracilis]